MKILLSAYYADPTGVSENYVGFRFWQLLDERHEVHLLTDELKRPSWERYLAGDAERLGRIHFVSLAGLRRIVPNFLNWPCYAFNVKAWLLGRRLQAQHRFDLVHHVTASQFRFPVFLAYLGLPFVWGPIGGAVPEPPGFDALFAGDRWDRRLRRFDGLLAKWDPLLGSTLGRAARLLVATPHFFSLFPGHLHERMRQFTLCGFDSADDRPDRSERPNGPLQLLFVGRLVPYKGLQYLIESVARLRTRRPVRLTVLGTGPFEEACRKQASDAGLDDIVDFCGKVGHDRVMAAMAACDVYVVPSLRESWGISPLEAMSMGRPVVAVANGGLDVVCDDASAVRIRPQSPEQVVADLTAALDRLAADPELRQTMGEAGRRRVREVFSWQRVADDLDRVYDEVLAEREVAPCTCSS